MTHDFHYYVTYMCARNAGFDIMTSKKIALCADGVDGGDMKFVNTSGGKYKKVAFKDGLNMISYHPLTVYHVTSSVNDDHSMGASIMSIPWMAFHFLPSLEVDPRTNPFYIKEIDRAIGKPKKDEGQHPRFSLFELNQSRHLESGLVCSKGSRFAKELIKDTAKLAKQYGRGKLNYIQAAMLGVRAHIIADLFAHEGFAGCRSMAANALNHANTLNESEMKYTLDRTKSAAASYVKTTGTSRLGHGQAGQRPDEPFVEYSIQRKLDNRNFVKDNRDLYGAAVMTLTEVFKGNSPNIPKDYENWQSVARDYMYKWEAIRDRMNQERPKRIKALREFFSKATDLREHNGTDYWAFGHMDGDLKMGFSIAADRHLGWFHEKFFELTGVGIDQYMDVSVLWPWSNAEDAKAREHNKNLLLGHKKIHVGKTSGDINGYQIGTHYMKRYDGGDLKPSTIYSKFTGIKVIG
jgi:hypothetical protein